MRAAVIILLATIVATVLATTPRRGWDGCPILTDVCTTVCAAGTQPVYKKDANGCFIGCPTCELKKRFTDARGTYYWGKRGWYLAKIYENETPVTKPATKVIPTKVVCVMPLPKFFKKIEKQDATTQSDAKFFKKFLKTAGGFLKGLGKQVLNSAKEGAMGYIQNAIA